MLNRKLVITFISWPCCHWFW